jgi:hypothetical protein
MEYVTTAVCVTVLFWNYEYFTEHHIYVNEIMLKGIQFFPYGIVLPTYDMKLTVI